MAGWVQHFSQHLTLHRLANNRHGLLHHQPETGKAEEDEQINPANWQAAFKLLTLAILNAPKNKPVIIFFDELPWLATKRSKFINMLDHFWNSEWKNIPNLKLIICGSAASWMIKKIVNDKGGLHNRLTKTILLEPFTLSQTHQFLLNKKMKFS